LFSKEKLETSYANGKALNNTMAGELDDTIDPADTRAWILMALESNPAMHKRRHGKKRPSVSTW
jgi:acetyl-CoA carboxylase carboxyltransferase component